MARKMLSVALLLLCTASMLSAQNTMQAGIDALIEKWTKALAAEDLTAYGSCYWPEATASMFDPKGQLQSFRGLSEIRNRQKGWFQAFDYSKINFIYPAPTRFLPSNEDTAMYLYLQKPFNQVTVFYFQRRNQDVRIITQIDMLYSS